ncbi:MAG TPA: hypothetical protein VI749_06530 [Candidatus Omnitrophota bacterium]|nr:hypothetical protein [Candidatus Omnitrophota bacterium]
MDNLKKNGNTPIPFAAVIWLLTTFKIITNDIWFELKSGELFLKNPSFHFTDTFSFLTQVKEFVNQEWAGEALFSLIHGASGIPGLILFKSFLIIGTFGLLFKLASIRRADFFIIMWILFLTLLVCRFRLTVRPHIISDFFLVLFMYILNRHTLGNKSLGYTLPFLMVIWTNFHFGSIVGLYLIGIYLLAYASALLFPRLQNKKTVSRTSFFHLVIIFILSYAATFINPAAQAFHSFADETLHLGYKLGVLEIVPPFLLPLEFFPLYWTLVAAYTLLIILNLKKVDMIDLFLFLFGLGLSLYMLRFIPLFGILAVPIITGILTDWLNHTRWPKLPNALRHPLLHIGIMLLITVALIRSDKGYLQQFEFGYGISKKHPFEAINFLKDNRIDGNIFNDIKYGGHIIFERYPDNKVYMYGRYTVFSDTIIKEYAEILSVNTDWQKLFDHYDINIVFLGSALAQGSALLRELSQSPLWHLVYLDDKALVFIKDIPEYAEIIKRYGIKLTVSNL